MTQALVRAPLVDQAIAHLRDEIERGTWPVGGKLPSEPCLAQQMGVGRSTVREAVRVLAHAGVLEVRQGSGTFVRTTTGDFAMRLQRAEAAEVYEVRRALEVEAAALAARRRTDDDLAAIEEALQRRATEREKGRGHDFLVADVAFHKAVVDAAHNPLLSTLYASSIAAIERAIEGVIADPSLATIPAGVHEQLAVAIRARDPRAAIAAVREHLDGTYDALTSVVHA